MFKCQGDSCILSIYICDGQKDCPYGEDEICHHFCSMKQIQISQLIVQWTVFLVYVHVHFLTFNARRGGCIPFINVCDAVPQCRDQSDEMHCNKEETDFQTSILPLHIRKRTFSNYSTFACTNTSLQIPLELVNDLIPDCPRGEDELELLSDLRISQCEQHLNPCHPGHSKCYQADNECIYDIDRLGNLKYCRNGEHLSNCSSFTCIGHFKCPNSYCLPAHLVCDGSVHCPSGEDEDNCSNIVCEGFYRCKTGLCIDLSHVCDGLYQCPIFGDDEAFCDLATCPPHCECFIYSISCNDTLACT